MTPQEALDHGLGELALVLPQGGRERLLGYVELIVKWNRTYNLTAIRDPMEMVTHHLLDSLAVIPHLPVASGAALADIGSGAGLPGIPLAIAREDWHLTLNEVNGKKAAFLRQAAIELGLRNLTVHEGRVQAWKPASLFAVVISRAFAELSPFIEACRHLVAADGVLAAMKGARRDLEIERVPAGCDCSRVIPLRVPLLDAQRHLILCRAGV